MDKEEKRTIAQWNIVDELIYQKGQPNEQRVLRDGPAMKINLVLESTGWESKFYVSYQREEGCLITGWKEVLIDEFIILLESFGHNIGVLIVTKGEDDDYRILGGFGTTQEAIQYKDVENTSNMHSCYKANIEWWIAWNFVGYIGGSNE